MCIATELLTASLHAMALPRVSANLPPYNPSKSTLAFGDRALPKIVRSNNLNQCLIAHILLILDGCTSEY